MDRRREHAVAQFDISCAIFMLEAPRAPVTSDEAFRKLVKAAFSQRRKTLSNALKPIAPKEKLQQAAGLAGIDLSRRE